MVRIQIFLALFFVALLVSGDAQGGNIYSWVDEQGNTNYGDKVPEKYRTDAGKIESTQVNSFDAPVRSQRAMPTPSEVDYRDYMDRDMRLPAAQGSEKDQSCKARMQSYRDSQACYAMFCQNAGGGINAGKCTNCRNITRPRC